MKHTILAQKLDKYTYDTTLPGYSNKGHYFADHLTVEQKAQLLAYLKTL